MHYLDIETTGTDPYDHDIITIQYARMNDATGRTATGNPDRDLKILKVWECRSEERLLRQFIAESGIVLNEWNFVPLGYNLGFEHKFLAGKAKQYGLKPINVAWQRPHIDLHHVGIIMNRGQFKGSGLDQITSKPHDGSVIPRWYYAREYDKIIDYVRSEFRSFVEFTSLLYENLGQMRDSLTGPHL